MKILVVFHRSRKKNNFPFTLVKNCRRRKISRMDSPYQLFFLLLLASSSIERTKNAGCVRKGRMKICLWNFHASLASLWRKTFSRIKDCWIYMRNTSEFLPLHDFFLFIIYRLFPRLSSSRKRSKKKISSEEKSMFIRLWVKTNLWTRRWLVNFQALHGKSNGGEKE